MVRVFRQSMYPDMEYWEEAQISFEKKFNIYEDAVKYAKRQAELLVNFEGLELIPSQSTPTMAYFTNREGYKVKLCMEISN